MFRIFHKKKFPWDLENSHDLNSICLTRVSSGWSEEAQRGKGGRSRITFPEPLVHDATR